MIEKFDNSNFTEILSKYSDFRKSFGLITANMCTLPIVKTGFIISGEIKDEDILDLKNEYGQIVMCRPDSNFNCWHKLHRGKDIDINNLTKYYDSIKKNYSSKLILLCFKHPSIYFTDHYIERYKISGGINILILWKDKIIIEYVSKGFDVGDISRGVINPHQRFVIPWNLIYKDTSELWKKINCEYVGEDEYLKSRNRRISFLYEIGYDLETIEKEISQKFTSISYFQFSKILRECILPTVAHSNLFFENKTISILINMYNNELHIFEIWESDK